MLEKKDKAFVQKKNAGGFDMKKSIIIGLLAVVLCCVGIYQVVQMPSPLSNAFRGTYSIDTEAMGMNANMYFSVDNREFHVFDEEAGLFLYGTYEQVGEQQYRMKGKHIEEQTIAFDEKGKKFTFRLGRGDISFVKTSDSTTVINDSLAKAKANDRMTAEQLDFLPNYNIFSGTYGYVDEKGNLSKERPYRMAVYEDTFCLYNEKTAYFMEGVSENKSASHYILSGEGMEKQDIYLQKNGIVLNLEGKDMVFVKLDDEIILPDSDPNQKIQ